VLSKHDVEIFGGFPDISQSDIQRLSERIPRELGKEMQSELAVASKFVHVLDWLKAEKGKFDLDADGLLSSAEIDKAASDPTKFKDAESQRMLQFLQKEFDAMSALKAKHKSMPTVGIWHFWSSRSA